MMGQKLHPEYFYSNSLYRELSRYDNLYVNKCISIEELREFLEKTIYNMIVFEFGKHIGFHVEIENVPTLRGIPAGWIGVGGEYMIQNNIVLEIMIHDDTSPEFIYFDEDKWDHLKRELGQTIDHEIIHSRQFKSRAHLDPDREFLVTYPDDPDKDYYGDGDEIQAYGYNIARDLLYYYDYKKPRVLKEIKNGFNTVELGCITGLDPYIRLFKDGEYYEDDIVWRKLIKTIIKYTELLHNEKF